MELIGARARCPYIRIGSRRATPFGRDKSRLCRECFQGHYLTIGNHPWQKRQQKLTLAGRPYPAILLPYNFWQQ